MPQDSRRTDVSAREKTARRGQHPDICGSHARGSTQTQRRRPGRPPSHLQSRWTRDRAVTAGALSHGTTAAGRCRRTACAYTSPPARSNWPRWRASAHSSDGGGLLTRVAKQVRATLGDAPVGRLRCGARPRATRTPFHVPSASRFYAAVVHFC